MSAITKIKLIGHPLGCYRFIAILAKGMKTVKKSDENRINLSLVVLWDGDGGFYYLVVTTEEDSKRQTRIATTTKLDFSKLTRRFNTVNYDIVSDDKK